MGIEELTIWVAVASGVGAVFRPVQNVVIFFLATRRADPAETKQIIEALATTRQFAPAADSSRVPGVRPPRSG